MGFKLGDYSLHCYAEGIDHSFRVSKSYCDKINDLFFLSMHMFLNIQTYVHMDEQQQMSQENTEQGKV